ncbi:unnamed protein product [Hermetia illucens]|uniref:Acid phosphatase n=1 Tax=Hermetia illucens TaxID=343691 RepID=A0A7R8UQ08_HERIL|nr:lysosomal acid phosphatase-like [Hermetia illucens]CAD7084888.1 unnamed protein product [Hermetia illucens]
METFRFYLLLIVACISYKPIRSSSLRGVLLLSRHGHRNPTAGYPNDPYRTHEWPGGYGALSARGIQQSCKSGETKALRYSHLLRPNNIYIKSSVSERCVQSAEAFLRGFLPNSLQNISINIVPAAEDESLVMPGKPCPKYDHTLSESLLLNQSKVWEILKGNKKVLDYVGKHSGLNITSLVDFLNIQDTLAIQASYDFEMPAWAQPIYNNYIMPLSQLAYHSLTNSALNQVRSGVLLNEIIERLQKGANGSGENVILLTGHDINLSGLLAYLSMANQIEGKPGFASTVALELHKSWYFQNDLEIRILFFEDETVQTPIQLRIPGCYTPCGFARFKKTVAETLIKDYEKRCNEER